MASPTANLSASVPTAPSPGIELRKILVPLDFSESAEIAFQFAVDLAVKFNAEVILLHVVELAQFSHYVASYPDFAPQPLDLAEMEGRTRKEAEEKLKPFSERLLARGVGAHRSVRTGFASPEILQAAKDQNADCIVIATHGYSGLTHFLMGSTTERVIRHAPCPVMVVRLKEAPAKK